MSVISGIIVDAAVSKRTGNVWFNVKFVKHYRQFWTNKLDFGLDDKIFFKGNKAFIVSEFYKDKEIKILS